MIPPTPMKKYVFLFLGCLSLSSCFYVAMYHFDSDDRVWLSPYEQGDTLIFVSLHGEEDTLFVEEAYLHDTHIPFIRNEGFSTFCASGGYNLTHLHSETSPSISLDIGKWDEKTLLIHIMFHTGSTFLFLETTNKIETKDIDIGGVKYHDAICVNKDNADTEIADNSPYNCEHFIWSKSKGLIQYKYIDGETYTLYKKLPHKK